MVSYKKFICKKIGFKCMCVRGAPFSKGKRYFWNSNQLADSKNHLHWNSIQRSTPSNGGRQTTKAAQDVFGGSCAGRCATMPWPIAFRSTPAVEAVASIPVGCRLSNLQEWRNDPIFDPLKSRPWIFPSAKFQILVLSIVRETAV